MMRDELFDAVRNYSNRPDVTEPNLLVFLSIVTPRLSRDLAGHPRTRTQTDVTVLADTHVLTYPADMVELIQLYGPDGVYIPRTDSRNTTSRVFVDYGTWAYIYPTPTIDTDITMDYYAMVPDIAAGTGTNWVLQHFPDVYMWGMLAELAEWLKDRESRAVWNTKYIDAVQSLMGQGWNQNLGSRGKNTVK